MCPPEHASLLMENVYISIMCPPQMNKTHCKMKKNVHVPSRACVITGGECIYFHHAPPANEQNTLQNKEKRHISGLDETCPISLGMHCILQPLRKTAARPVFLRLRYRMPKTHCKIKKNVLFGWTAWEDLGVLSAFWVGDVRSAHTYVVAVKKLVVGFLLRSNSAAKLANYGL